MILPPAMLAVMGGGQLGRFFVVAAREMGYRVTVLDPDPQSPAGSMADRHICADYLDPAALVEIATSCSAVTTEFENVPAAGLEQLARSIVVAPHAAAVGVAQDRTREKAFLTEHGFPIGPYIAVECTEDLHRAPLTLFPAILKLARLGYDGKGQAVVRDRSAAVHAWQSLGARPSVLEQKLPLDCEVSVVLARARDGSTVAFPAAENTHHQGILDVSIAPARIGSQLTQQAGELARGVATRLEYVGVLGVEMFVSDGRLLINEIAPRPHNSGHYTLDACVTDQFEQQVRALCGLPLGAPDLLRPAVMVNLLGDIWHAGEPAWQKLLADSALKLHLYGKTEARPGRKMGHFTVLDATVEGGLKRALASRHDIGVDGAVVSA